MLDCEIIIFIMSNPTLISVCNQFCYLYQIKF